MWMKKEKIIAVGGTWQIKKCFSMIVFVFFASNHFVFSFTILLTSDHRWRCSTVGCCCLYTAFILIIWPSVSSTVMVNSHDAEATKIKYAQLFAATKWQHFYTRQPNCEGHFHYNIWKLYIRQKQQHFDRKS